MRQKSPVRASSRWGNEWVCWDRAIRGSFRRGFGWPPLYRQSMQHTLALLLLLLRLREEDVIDGYVDFHNSQSHQVLDPPYNVAAHRFGYLRYGPAVLYSQREVDGGLLFADLHRDATGGARASCHAVEDSTDGAGGATAHLYPFDLLRCDAGDLGD